MEGGTRLKETRSEQEGAAAAAAAHGFAVSIPLTLPHPLPASGPQRCPGAELATDSRILNAELTAREASVSHLREMTVSVMI